MPVDGVGPAQNARTEQTQVRREDESAQRAREQRANEEARQQRAAESDGSVDITA